MKNILFSLSLFTIIIVFFANPVKTFSRSHHNTFLSNGTPDTILQSVTIELHHISCQGEGFIEVSELMPFANNYLIDWTGPLGFTSNEFSFSVWEPGSYVFSISHPSTTLQFIDTVKIEADIEYPDFYIDMSLICDSTLLLSAIMIDTSKIVQYDWSGPGILTNKDSCCVLVNAIGAYTAELGDLSNGCSLAQQIQVTTLDCTSTSEFFSHHAELKIYPNPFNQLLNIDSSVPFERVSVFDCLGRNIKSFEGNRESIYLSLEGHGLYRFRFEYADYTVWKSLIKSN